MKISPNILIPTTALVLTAGCGTAESPQDYNTQFCHSKRIESSWYPAVAKGSGNTALRLTVRVPQELTPDTNVLVSYRHNGDHWAEGMPIALSHFKPNTPLHLATDVGDPATQYSVRFGDRTGAEACLSEPTVSFSEPMPQGQANAGADVVHWNDVKAY